MQSPDLWLILKELFEEARVCNPEERKTVLDRISRDHADLYEEVVELLKAHDRSSAFLEKPAYKPSGLPGAPGGEGIAIIGPYTLFEIIGIGGMSVVYKTRQENTQRLVALKMMRSGLAGQDREWAARRFEVESRILGRLRHNNIAQVFEAGTHRENGESIPYFVMEYVHEAKTVVDYCSNNRFSQTDRLLLFCQVCDAIHHGHSNGIIHRDIKPGNLLVDSSGQPKVIDFGVARLMDDDTTSARAQTQTGMILGTLRYMSPEQLESAGQDLDTRSDIYSLGVVMYELLCGCLPYTLEGLNPCQVADAIRSVRPLSPGEIDRSLRGDLETILLKALDKDRTGRYDSVAALRADIDRYLQHQPIQARPPSTIYQIRKLIARHKLSSVLTLTMVVLLFAFSVIMTFQSAELRKERNAAEEAQGEAEAAEKRASQEADMAWAAHEVLKNLFSAANPIFPQYFSEVGLPPVRKQDLTVRELMDVHGERVVDQFDDQPLIQASLLNVMGYTYLCSGEYAKGLAVLERAVDLLRDILPEDHVQSLSTKSLYSLALLLQTRLDEAESLARHCMDVIENSDKDLEEMLPQFLDVIADAANARKDLDEALEYHQRSLEIKARLLGPEHEDTGATLLSIATVNFSLGELELAEAGMRRALEVFTIAYGADHPVISLALRHLGILLHENDRFEEAIDCYRRALKIQRAELPEGHPFINVTLGNLGTLMTTMNRLDQACIYIEEAVEGNMQALGEDDIVTVQSLLLLEGVKLLQNKASEGEEICRRVLRLAEANPNWPMSVECKAKTDLIKVFSMQNRDSGEAEGYFEEANAYYSSHGLFQDLISLYCNMSVYYAREGRMEKAEKVFLEIVDLELDRAGGRVSSYFASYLFSPLAHLIPHLDFCERFIGHEHAEIVFASAFDYCMKFYSAGAEWGSIRVFVFRFKMLLGQILLEKGRLVEAEKCLRESDEFFVEVKGVESDHCMITRSLLGACLSALKKRDEAESLLLESYQWMLDNRGPDYPEIGNARERVRAFYEAWNEPERAREFERGGVN